jgi:flavin-dependent dehydrogenase
VLLVDPLPDLRRAAFSSAALPIEAVHSLDLPEAVVAQRWSGWRLLGPGSSRREWNSRSGLPLGAVLDFGALRQWLAHRAAEAGARLQLGCRVRSVQPDGTALLQGPGGQFQSIRARWVVDATGQQRALLGDPEVAGDPLVSGVGAEWLLQVTPQQWQGWADRLSFLLGSDWVPQGYGWVFPMQPGLLKVGVCRLLDPTPGSHQPPLLGLQHRLLQRLDLEHASVIDRHGGWIRSTVRRREPHRRGAVIGLGDAVSTANLLGGEGIRHAMASSAVLAPLLLQALAGRERALERYAPRLRRQLGWRWSLSGRLARRTWLGLDGAAADARLDRLLRGLEASASAEDLGALLFQYRFERYGWRALPYALGWR